MSDKTGIEWTDATWNPISGCTEVSPGCDHCYAKTFAERWRGTEGHYFEHGFDVQLRPDKLDQPLRWRKPRKIFVNSMSDLFHDQIPDGYIAEVWAVMALAPQHTFQVLTKRHGRMRSLLNDLTFWDAVGHKVNQIYDSGSLGEHPGWVWPNTEPVVFDNIWLGVSAENQRWADIRIPALLETPAAVRFVSAEPLLGPIGLQMEYREDPDEICGGCSGVIGIRHEPACGREPGPHWGIDWVIVGGESGGGARPMHPNWARGLRDQCQAAGVAFLFKQRGEWTWNEPNEFRLPTKPYTNRVAVMHGAGMMAMTKDNDFNPFERGHPHWTTRIERVGKHRAGRLLDGREWNDFPEAIHG